MADEEVKLVVVAQPGAEIDPAELVAFLADRLPRFMVPRYVEVVDALPKTPTQRVRKHVLRGYGDSAATWDREAAGYRVTRAGLVPPGSLPAAGSVGR
jgi:carnitine-CoA ligase